MLSTTIINMQKYIIKNYFINLRNKINNDISVKIINSRNIYCNLLKINTRIYDTRKFNKFKSSERQWDLDWEISPNFDIHVRRTTKMKIRNWSKVRSTHFKTPCVFVKNKDLKVKSGGSTIPWRLRTLAIDRNRFDCDALVVRLEEYR